MSQNKIGAGRLMGPKGVAVDKNGHIITVDNKACCVFIFQSNGKLVTKFGGRGTSDRQFAGEDEEEEALKRNPSVSFFSPPPASESVKINLSSIRRDSKDHCMDTKCVWGFERVLRRVFATLLLTDKGASLKRQLWAEKQHEGHLQSLAHTSLMKVGNDAHPYFPHEARCVSCPLV